MPGTDRRRGPAARMPRSSRPAMRNREQAGGPYPVTCPAMKAHGPAAIGGGRCPFSHRAVSMEAQGPDMRRGAWTPRGRPPPTNSGTGTGPAPMISLSGTCTDQGPVNTGEGARRPRAQAGRHHPLSTPPLARVGRARHGKTVGMMWNVVVDEPARPTRGQQHRSGRAASQRPVLLPIFNARPAGWTVFLKRLPPAR